MSDVTQHDPRDLAALLPGLRVIAARCSRVAEDAEDLLHDALLEAVRAGRADLSQAENYRWVVGTLRNLGTMTARSAVRRRLREARWLSERSVLADDANAGAGAPSPWREHPAVRALPASLRDVAHLALAGFDRREITWLLKLSDTAMRQRISALRKRLGALAPRGDGDTPGEGGVGSDPAAPGAESLPLGLIRRALLPVAVAADAVGAHDPDGHLLAISASGAHVLAIGGNKRVHTDTSSRSSQEPAQ